MADVLLAIPCGKNNPDLVGGQVTAARGLLDFVNSKGIPCTLVDTAEPAALERRWSRLCAKVRVVWSSLKVAALGQQKSALFFKSTNLGLIERSIPALVLRLRGVKVGLFFRNSQIFSLKPGSIQDRYVRVLLKPYSVFFVQGERWKAHLVSMGFPSSQVVVIPNWLPVGFDVLPKRKPAPQAPVRFVFTGKIVREKGVFEVLEALGTDDLASRCEFVFAGDGPAFRECQQWLENRGWDNVSFVGNLGSEAIRELLSNSDVFVMPSYHEGFPNSVLEAMALGLPVIATPVGAIGDSIVDGENGLLIQCRSPRSLADAMTHYLDNRSLIATHSEAALATVRRRHDRNVNCEKLLASLQ